VPKSPRSSDAPSASLRSAKAYEDFIYALPDAFPSIEFSTLTLVRISTYTARIEGDLHFPREMTLRVKQLVDFHERLIRQYSYELYRRGEKLWWYDPWPHPEKSLANTHPHHKHIGPDIKHNRISAPGLSFERPNLPLLIREIEELLAK
jgi:hypothetical protein